MTTRMAGQLRSGRRSRHLKVIQNPPWASEVIANTYDTLAITLPNRQWLPLLEDVTFANDRITADAREFGCGSYGCVFPTLDQSVVMKITTDDTEAEFAGNYANTLVAPICVRYHHVLKLDMEYRGDTIYLLWRESAINVGRINVIVEARFGAVEAVFDKQHHAAHAAYSALLEYPDAPATKEMIQTWLFACEEMTDIPDLEPLAVGMIRCYREQGIFLGDVHLGNVGQVWRDDKYEWVITDPGHIAIVQDH